VIGTNRAKVPTSQNDAKRPLKEVGTPLELPIGSTIESAQGEIYLHVNLRITNHY